MIENFFEKIFESADKVMCWLDRRRESGFTKRFMIIVIAFVLSCAFGAAIRIYFLGG